MTAPRVLLANHWHDDNKGDSAITGGILRLLGERRPDAQVRIATLHEAHTKAYISQVRHVAAAHGATAEPSTAPTEIGSGPPGTRTTTLRWLRRLAPLALEVSRGKPGRATRARLHDVDLLVLVGGSNVYDDPDVRAPLSLARLTGILYPAWAAGRLGIPVVLAGHTLGPFPRRVGMRLARRMLAGTRRAALREETSVPVARRLGLDQAHVRPDMAFATEAILSPRVADVLARLPDGGARTLALVVRTHPHAGEAADRRVAEALARTARAAVADGTVTSVLVVAHTLGPTALEDDRPAARRLHALLDGVPSAYVEDDLGPGELAALYGRCALVATVRLHAAILALSQGTPAFAIAYMTRKTEGVMTAAGLPDAWCAYDEVTPERVARALPSLLAPETRARLTRARDAWLAELRDEARAWDALLDRQVERASTTA